ncbi:MAG: Zinc-containing alcohol dehydrogenase superfamily [Proteobacteria bacterium]|nr:Zinc-containing alcohol dehydrogenase superfamily [Pseudomonadota bacterium]
MKFGAVITSLCSNNDNEETTMPHAIRIHQTGGPEVLSWEAVDLPAPGAGEATIRHHAVGLNYIDTYHRTGLYPLPLPSGIGLEGAGVVEAVGEGVSEVKVGDRVAYAGGPIGAYAEVRNIPAHRLLALPDSISFETGAAMMLQGLTAAYLLRKTYRVQPGDAVLIHAAAGGVGLIACQWAKALGATVIGTVGSAAKAELAMAHGCDHVINYSSENFTQRVREITGGEGVAVVYDGVGKDTFMGSLDSLRPMGMMVAYGNASGPVPPLDLLLLSQKGSLFVTRPTITSYTAKRADLVDLGSELFEVVASGKVRVEVNQTYALKDAAQAHRDLEARKTTGSTILLP